MSLHIQSSGSFQGKHNEAQTWELLHYIEPCRRQLPEDWMVNSTTYYTEEPINTSTQAIMMIERMRL